jgi:hypothetical protein
MDEARSLADQLSASANEFWTTVGGYLPKFFTALLLLVVALVIAKLVQSVVTRGLELVGVNKFLKTKSVTKTLKVADVKVNLVDVVGRVLFWVVIIVFALTIADVLELTAMRDVIRELLAYLPNLLAAVIVLTVTVAGARLVSDLIAAALARMQVDYANKVAAVAFYVLIVFGGLMALDQLGFDTTVLTANVTVIVAGVVLAFALAFGLGGRDTAGRIVEDAYKRFKTTSKK